MADNTTQRTGWRLGLFRFAIFAGVCVLATLTAVGLWLRWAHAPVKLIVSKETTFVTSPLRPDGSVDFLAAINAYAGDGVTPENNGAVLFWRAMGSRGLEPEHRQKFFEQLGIPPVAEEGEYFVELSFNYKEQDKLAQLVGDPERSSRSEFLYDNQLDEAITRPWSSKEFPVLAASLAKNEKPLLLLSAAARRPQWYDPITSSDDTLLGAVFANMETSNRMRRLAWILVARSMQHAQAGKINEAWEDLITCHLLARHAAHRSSLVNCLISDVIDARACEGDQALLQHASLTANQIERMRADLAGLPPMPTYAEAIDMRERLGLLDGVLHITNAESSVRRETLREALPDATMVADLVSKTTLDSNIALRIVNAWVDRGVAACRIASRSQRRTELQRIDDEVQELKAEVNNSAGLVKSMLTDPQKAASERIGQIFVVLNMRAITFPCSSEIKREMRFELVKLGFALAAYRAEHETYPDVLADLIPKYITRVPIDIYSDAELHYERQPEGYLLYSVGENGKDDGGETMLEADDISIRVPAAKKP